MIWGDSDGQCIVHTNTNNGTKQSIFLEQTITTQKAQAHNSYTEVQAEVIGGNPIIKY